MFITFFLKGVIMEGSDADIVVWDPNGERRISASTHSQVSERDGLTHLANPRQGFVQDFWFGGGEIYWCINEARKCEGLPEKILRIWPP